MWLKSLHAENFRGFEKLDVTFDEHVTLLLGGNGAGKTAVLEAIAVGFGAFFAKIDQGPVKHIDADDARRVAYDLNGIPDFQEQWPVTIGMVIDPGTLPTNEFRGIVDIAWTRVREDRGGRTGRANEGHIRETAERLQLQVQAGQLIDLPLVAYYGTQRLWRGKRTSEAIESRGNRLDGYLDCLDIASSQRHLRDWMRQKTLEEVQQQSTNPGYRHPQLAAVVTAVKACIDGVSRFWFDLMRDEIRIVRGATVESFAMLSDGYRNMVAMVADIAERAAVLNPQHGEAAARLTTGVVLIDELELHLHPKWQRTVVPSLCRTFPKMQFIATTHSPQILSTVERTQVRIFRDNQLVASDGFVAGRDANELLEDIFGVSARPEASQRQLDELFRLLDREEFDSARAMLLALETQLGPHAEAIVRARWTLDAEAPLPAAPATS